MSDNFFIKNVQFKDLFYIVSDTDLIHDCNLAEIVKISVDQYRYILIKEYNAHMAKGEIFFNKEQDAKKAIDWLDSLFILNKLRGV
jgi:hypothetical protein